ncbi:hypothetical protein GYMLUDRAFT_459601 [Collybiopsis luxurians FD-317 M1]|uniref:Uncharacterized protein n=1 Tax=Collybiopsis luxurians FD-317 M1 TaxID=944289 RepID=A0A0D0AK26_9AGAR|nr:hypothetical protein GYMLUDRAFT_459601 [Collybiopsis luxurians FD-317 M1]
MWMCLRVRWGCMDPNTNVSGITLSRTISRDDGDLQDPAEVAMWKGELFKEWNWVLVEFTTLTSLPLFGEYVPKEYRAQRGLQLAGIHPSLILNPSLGSVYSSSISTSPPSSSSTGGRVRLSSLFSSPGHAGATSTASPADTGRGKKEKKGGSIFSGSTKALTMASTPTPYDPRNGQSGTPYSRQTYADDTTSSTTDQ